MISQIPKQEYQIEKQLREYYEYGRAKTDTHYGHPDNHPELKSPHFHDWKWYGDILHKGDHYDVARGVCGVKLVVVCAIRVNDDFLVAPVGSGVGKGMTIIFGG